MGRIVALLLFLFMATSAFAQEKVKISELPDGGSIQANDIVPVIRGNKTYQAKFPSLSNVAITGAYFDLTSRPSLGSLSMQEASNVSITGGSLANVTASGLSLSNITGSTQCLQVNSSGLISGTGFNCGTGIIENGTPGQVAMFTSTGNTISPVTIGGAITIAPSGTATLSGSATVTPTGGSSASVYTDTSASLAKWIDGIRKWLIWLGADEINILDTKYGIVVDGNNASATNDGSNDIVTISDSTIPNNITSMVGKLCFKPHDTNMQMKTHCVWRGSFTEKISSTQVRLDSVPSEACGSGECNLYWGTNNYTGLQQAFTEACTSMNYKKSIKIVAKGALDGIDDNRGIYYRGTITCNGYSGEGAKVIVDLPITLFADSGTGNTGDTSVAITSNYGFNIRELKLNPLGSSGIHMGTSGGTGSGYIYNLKIYAAGNKSGQFGLKISNNYWDVYNFKASGSGYDSIVINASDIRIFGAHLDGGTNFIRHQSGGNNMFYGMVCDSFGNSDGSDGSCLKIEGASKAIWADIQAFTCGGVYPNKIISIEGSSNNNIHVRAESRKMGAPGGLVSLTASTILDLNVYAKADNTYQCGSWGANHTLGINYGSGVGSSSFITVDLDDNITPYSGTVAGTLNINSGSTISKWLNGGLYMQIQPNTSISSMSLGRNALISVTSSAVQNTAIGAESLYALTACSQNTAVGYQAGRNVLSSENVFVGRSAVLGSSTTPLTGNSNTVIGRAAGYMLSGSAAQNVIVGTSALNTGFSGSNLATGSGNVVIGFNALPASGNFTGNNNVAIGHWIAPTLLTGSHNILIGTSSLVNVTASNASYTMNIGRAITAVGLDTATPTVTIPGSLYVGTGFSAGKATCWKSGGQLGYCSSGVDSSGNCTCN